MAEHTITLSDYLEAGVASIIADRIADPAWPRNAPAPTVAEVVAEFLESGASLRVRADRAAAIARKGALVDLHAEIDAASPAVIEKVREALKAKTDSKAFPNAEEIR